MMISMQNSAHRQKGFTLIEALVAFLILSIGMLGIASLQLISLKAGHTAAFRTVAVIKVEEMFERIRNNPVEVASYGTAVAVNNSCNDYGPPVECNSLQMVSYDIYEWEQGLIASLSANAGVTATIVVVDPVENVQPLYAVTITVSWQERNTATQTMNAVSYSASADICDSTAC